MTDKIVTFRDENSEVLFKKTEKIKDFDQSLVLLVETMKEIMEKSDGLGLAAPQINSSKAVCIIKNRGKVNALCNPKIVEHSLDKETMEEGCLSFPDIFLQVPRPREIVVEYQDISGKKKIKKANGLFARAIQHEVDHLSGVVFTARAKI